MPAESGVHLGKKMGAIAWTQIRPEEDIANASHGVQSCDLRLDLGLDTRFI